MIVKKIKFKSKYPKYVVQTMRKATVIANPMSQSKFESLNDNYTFVSK